MKKTLFFIFVLFMVSICLVPIGREAYQEVAMPTAEALVRGAEGARRKSNS